MAKKRAVLPMMMMMMMMMMMIGPDWIYMPQRGKSDGPF
jgi:hypothetical protein